MTSIKQKNLTMRNLKKKHLPRIPRQLLQMVKNTMLFVLVWEVVVFPSQAQTHTLDVLKCASFLIKGKILTESNIIPLCRDSFVTFYNPATKTPTYTSHLLDKNKVLNGCNVRTNNFQTDASLPRNLQVQETDYVRSGYDRGHLVPDADLKYSKTSEDDSFVMSNIAPQAPALNRGVWKDLEEFTRKLAVQKDLQVLSGTIYTDRKTKIHGDITVPTGFFKIIFELSSNKYYAFLFKSNQNADYGDFRTYQATIAEIEQYAGITINSTSQKNTTFDLPRVKKYKKNCLTNKKF